MQERSKEQLNEILKGFINNEKKFGIDWDHSEDLAERQRKVEQIGYNKEVILKTLLGVGDFGKPFQTDVGLHLLFRKHFSTLIDKEYTVEDLRQLKTLNANLSELSKYVPKVIVKNGYYKDTDIKKNSCILWSSLFIGPNNLGVTLIGASAANKAIWFIFDKHDGDVNKGYVYVRRTPFSKIELLSTFEINPFIQGKTLVTNKETGIAEEKLKITFNPAWLTSTLDNMEKHVFKIVS